MKKWKLKLSSIRFIFSISKLCIIIIISSSSSRSYHQQARLQHLLSCNLTTTRGFKEEQKTQAISFLNRMWLWFPATKLPSSARADIDSFFTSLLITMNTFSLIGCFFNHVHTTWWEHESNGFKMWELWPFHRNLLTISLETNLPLSISSHFK